MAREKKPTLYWFTKPLQRSEKFSVYGRVTYQRKKAEFATGLQSIQSDCEKIRDRHIVGEMAQYENKLEETFIVLKHNQTRVTAKLLRDVLIGKQATSKSLKVFLLEMKEEVANDKEYSKSSKTLYDTTIRYVVEFLGADDYQFNELDQRFVRDLDHFLINKKSALDELVTLSRNTVNKHHSRFRTLLFKAVDQGLITNNPYNGTKVIKYQKTSIRYLDEKELGELEKLDLSSSDKLQVALDYFLFTVYTGLRYGDVFKLKMEDIITRNGKKYLRQIQSKTKDDVSLPVLKKALDIIEHYNDHHERVITNKVLPSLSNQKVNEYLKIVQAGTSIKQPLTHHMARHTCATYLLSNGFDIALVQQWLGHEDINTTRRYAKFTQKGLDRVADELNNKD